MLQKTNRHQSNIVFRSRSESQYDEKYANYWIKEYGADPDDIRLRYIFPAIEELIPEPESLDDGRVFFDFGCGAGSAIHAIRGWNCKSYVGIDVNERMIERAKDAYFDAGTGCLKGDPQSRPIRASFVRRNFEQLGWQNGLDFPFDIGISMFVLNELRSQENYLKGIYDLRSRKKSEKSKSRLILILTHPSLVLRDLSEFYYGKVNHRKFESIETYKSGGDAAGYYSFSRGDFSARYYHTSFEALWRLLDKCRMKVEKLREISYSSTHSSEKDHVANQYPKILILRIGFHG